MYIIIVYRQNAKLFTVNQMILKNKWKLLSVFVCIFLTGAFCAYAAASPALAEDAIATQIELPSTYLEYRQLTEPRDIYFDKDITVVLEEDGTIVIYQDGLYKEITGNTNLLKVRRLGDHLILQQRGEIKSYSLTEGGSDLTTLTDKASAPLSYTAFDTNGDYLVAFAGKEIALYAVSYEQNIPVFTKTNFAAEGISTGSISHIAINSNNDIFYFNSGDNKLFYVNVSTPSVKTDLGSYAAPNGMIANGDYVYLSTSDGVMRVNISARTSEVFLETVSSSSERPVDELPIENLVSPMGMAFKDKNILISDNYCNKIVEYDVADGTYTGWAIATTANADNRLGKDTLAISLYGDDVAALNNTEVSLREKGVYRKISLEAMDIKYKPKNLALGEKYICVADSFNLTFVERETLQVAECETGDLRPISLTYSNGVYYVMSGNSVYAFDENELKADLTSPVLNRENYSSNDLLAADVDGNVYVYSDQQKTVFKYESGVNTDSMALSAAARGIGADLNGNVYALLDNNTLEYFKNNEKKSVKLSLSPNLPAEATASAMAMSFDNPKIYFLFNGYGFILSTAEAENDNINDIPVPEDFTLSAAQAKPLAEFRLYTLKANKNVYTMDYADGKFTFRELKKADDKEYVYAGESQGFAILLSDEIALVKINDAEENIPATESDIAEGYAATDVYMYYYPILTFGGEYKLTGAERLKTDQKIVINGKISINGKGFYYVSANDTFGFVPADFVTEKLAQAYDRETYSYKTVNGSAKRIVAVYADLTMTEKTDTIESAIEVKAHPTENPNVFYIEYETDGNAAGGYVYSDDFKQEGKYTVRNAVIICLVALSVAVTSLYFVNRRKTH